MREPLSGARGPEAWRRELSARLNRYRTRHKAPPPRYPSLQLPFEPGAPALDTQILEESPTAVLDSTVEDSTVEDSTVENSRPGEGGLEAGSAPPGSRARVESSGPQPDSAPGAKIIEFPRLAWAPPPPPADQLAEPMVDRPRILEVPEVVPPPPALGGITMDPARLAEPEKRPGIDGPFESAPLARRLVASAIDGLIVGAAALFFAFIFWKVTLFRPPRMQLLSLGAGIPCLFWVVYQHLLIVYAGSTPGLRWARLRLTCFDGAPARRSLRRWRVLASYLSAASLGMGYVWLFLDEDNLCWHDRITHTYLAAAKGGFEGPTSPGLLPSRKLPSVFCRRDSCQFAQEVPRRKPARVGR
jgi:uncharacterized RDD family membrane protein YckC